MLTLTRLLSFSRRVLSRFVSGKGLLLAGSVAYNGLLSLVPLLAVSLALLSYWFEPERLLRVIELELGWLAPGQTKLLRQEIARFLDHRELIWGVGLAVLLFFSALAFRMLEDAMAILFHRSSPAGAGLDLGRVLRRDFWLSAVIPFGYILIVALVMLALTVVLSWAEWVVGRDWAGVVLWLVGFAVQVLLLASVYKVMPVIEVGLRRALIGGLAAGLLWSITRSLLGWWFAHISLVDRIYGSLTAVVVLLLTLEIAAVIVLLGAQVIAELEWSEEVGAPWWVGAHEPPEHPLPPADPP